MIMLDGSLMLDNFIISLNRFNGFTFKLESPYSSGRAIKNYLRSETAIIYKVKI